MRSRSKTEEFAQELRKQGFIAQAYHAGMSSNDKQRILEQFKMHQLDVVICTNAFGMGIDRANIHTVIHYSPPHNLESYLQEIGRAARKIGEKGRAILYWSQTDLDQLVQQNIDSQIGGHKVLLECWQQVIANVLKREKVSDRWFTAQELQTFLSFEGEELVTQIRVILLALEKYNLLVEKEHLPALLSLKLIDAPASTEGQAAELYRRLVPLIQQNDSQLYLPEISVALGLNVKSLLRGIRQLVKLGCARWACEVRIRLSKRHALLQRQLKYKREALVALEDCWSMYEPDEIERIDLNKSWYEQTNIFEGSVEFIKDENGQGKIIVSHTAIETKDLGDFILNKQVDEYKKKGLIDPEERIKKITFSDFSNEERFQFFFKLTNELDCVFFDCETIRDISIKPEDISLPEEIKWMEELNMIVLSGNSLDKKAFIKNENYHKHLILWNLEAIYKYELNGQEGTISVNFGFPDYATKLEKAEFELHISNFQVKKISIQNLKKS